MRESREDEHFVLTEVHCPGGPHGAATVVPCWRRDQDYVPAILAEVARLRLEVVLIQYANDIFGDDDRLPLLLAGLRAAGVASVVNLHSVYPPAARTHYVPGGDSQSFDRAVATKASALLVHTERMRQDLKSRGVDPERIVIIPHGTLIRPRPDRLAARQRFGVPENAKLLLFFGFVWPGKGIDFLLDVFARVCERVPDAFLYLGGYTRKKVFYTRAYMRYLRMRMWWLGVSERCKLYGDYVPDDDVPGLYAAADVVVLPYRQGYSSVSGVVHQAAGLGTLMICSRIFKFEEVGDAISPELLAEYGDRKEWADRLVKLLADDAFRVDMTARMERFAEATRWSTVGKQHLTLFDGLRARPASVGALARE
jgi:glycosyltransferase involved in cell wall biosynthesis